MTPDSPNPAAFLSALEASLSEWECANPSRFEGWNRPSRRTHIMKGDAVKRSASQSHIPRTTNHLLGDALGRLGFSSLKTAEDRRRTYQHEWRQIDLAAIECEENWNRDCWRGRYSASYLIEVENNLQEFVLTMRGMLDVRARVSCGIFYAPHATANLDELQVGTGATKSERRALGQVLDQWKRLTTVTDGSSMAEMVAVFLSDELDPQTGRPGIVGHRIWKSPA